MYCTLKKWETTLNLVKVEHDEQSLQIFILVLQIPELLLVYPENELLIGIHQAFKVNCTAF